MPGEQRKGSVSSTSGIDPGREDMVMRMDGDIDANTAIHQDAESPKLTFAALNARIDALPEFPEDSPTFPKRAIQGFAFATAGALFSLLCVKLLPGNTYTVVFSSLGLTVELAGIAVALLSVAPRKWLTFANERQGFAERLDFDLPHHVALVEWLRTFPIEQRKVLGDFVAYRHARMKERLPILTGSIEKLGLLPVIIALYLQFKDMRWPPHPSWLEIILIFALVLGYWLSVLQISVRLRLQLYEMLLSKALV